MDPRRRVKSKPQTSSDRNYRDKNREKSPPEKENANLSTSERVVKLLNSASLDSIKGSQKIEKLSQVQELILHKEPQLLDNFFDELMAFQTDPSADVRKFVVGFMEEASKKDNDLVVKVISYLKYLIPDKNVAVVKRVIQCATHLFRVTLKWLNEAKLIRKNHKACWDVFVDLNTVIITLLDSMNDGVRTQTIKYVEKVVITLSRLRKDSELPKKEEAMSSLDEVLPNHEILNRDNLDGMGKDAFQKLLAFVASPVISSVNLMAALGTLTSIAKQRPQFMSTIVLAFESLHANLPPTLSKSQVMSVRKHLKMQLLNMLKHQSSIEFHPQMTNLLYDLGTNSNEIAKNMAKIIGRPDSRKRGAESKAEKSDGKKIKTEEPDIVGDPEEEAFPEPSTSKELLQPVVEPISAVDITANVLAPLLTPENVANLVLLSMVMLPDKMPDAFHASYTPIESAGTEDQKLHLARLLSVQMTAMGIGPGVAKADELRAQELEQTKTRQRSEKTNEQKNKKQQIMTVIGGATKTRETEQKKSSSNQPETFIPVQPVLPKSSLQRRIQGFKLESITQPLSIDTKDRFIKMAVLRILKSEKQTLLSGVHDKWMKIITSLVAQFGGELHRTLATYILEDLRSRAELAFMWLFEEYNIFLENSHGDDDLAMQENYNACLTGLLQGLMDKHTARDNLFTRLVLQAPLLTDDAINKIKDYCMQDDEKRTQHGLMLVRDLITLRPTKKLQFLKVLLELAVSDKEYTQNKSIECLKRIMKKPSLQPMILQFACGNLNYLTLAQPPHELCPNDKEWAESSIKQCVSLFLALLPMHQDLIHTLADVYTKSSADIKRVTLRLLDQPVIAMGMNSPELLRLVENCPTGAETLVTRMLHILTDRLQPTRELVSKVRELYMRRVPDVRFLIPVLTGLEKSEVVEALPKLIRLNPPVVKGVFNRLLSAHRSDFNHSSNIITPVELLVALHNISTEQADVKSVIKATSLCFSDRTVYTSEVLVTVINRLVEQEEIPTLLMRTVIQALITYPRLSGFIMNILQRLIQKKVWLQTKVWEGFIRCCQRMRPQSYQVLLQLPAKQLKSVFNTAKELKRPLYQHVSRLTEQQRQHVDKHVLKLLAEGEEILPSTTEPDVMDINPPGTNPSKPRKTSFTDVKTEQADVYTMMAPYTIIPPGMPLPIIQTLPPSSNSRRSSKGSSSRKDSPSNRREMRSPTPTQDEEDYDLSPKAKRSRDK